MKRIMITLAAPLSLTLLAGAALAEGGAARFEAIDANGDGQITQAEMETHRNARFAAADTNGDGALDRAELIAAAQIREEERRTARIDRMIERADEDETGTLTLAELQPRRGSFEERFERMDRDEDGTLSLEEFERGARRGGFDRGPRGR